MLMCRLVFCFLFCPVLLLSPVTAQPADPSTMTGKIMCGYQGWFRVEGDGSGKGNFHYGPRDFGPGKCSIEMWPDMSEMEDDEKYPTAFKHADGSTAYVFSSTNRKTVTRHFQWMEECGLDGVFLQRFVGQTRSENNRKDLNIVMENVRYGAEKHNRVWAMMYDLTGGRPGDLTGLLINDWKRLVDEDKIRQDRMYLHHAGKPVVTVWGIGFNDNRQYTLQECLQLVTFLKEDPKYGGNTVMIGVPTYWRQMERDALNDPVLHEIARKADIVSPWTIGRYGTPQQAENYTKRVAAADLAWCKENNVEFMPVVFPGFSWYNLMKGRGQEAIFDQIPRLKGEFLSTQIRGHMENNVTMIYQAMFDELDEGTAIFKCTNDPPVGLSPFLKLDDLPSDFYLKLVGRAAKELKQKMERKSAP